METAEERGRRHEGLGDRLKTRLGSADVDEPEIVEVSGFPADMREKFFEMVQLYQRAALSYHAEVWLPGWASLSEGQSWAIT